MFSLKASRKPLLCAQCYATQFIHNFLIWLSQGSYYLSLVMYPFYRWKNRDNKDGITRIILKLSILLLPNPFHKRMCLRIQSPESGLYTHIEKQDTCIKHGFCLTTDFSASRITFSFYICSTTLSELFQKWQTFWKWSTFELGGLIPI